MRQVKAFSPFWSSDGNIRADELWGATGSMIKFYEKGLSFSTCQLFLLQPFVSLHPHESTFLDPSDLRNTQLDQHRVFPSSAPLFPGAQIISPTSLKTHEMLHRRTVPLSLGLLTSVLRRRLPPHGQELAHSIHLHLGYAFTCMTD